MNFALTKIANLTDKPRLIIGLMSGTSLDGLDIALCKVSGHGLATCLKVKLFTTIKYSDEFLTTIKPLFANPSAPLVKVALANAWLAREHAKLVLQALAKWEIDSSEIDFLASHGQTIFHAPNSFTCLASDNEFDENNLASATLQIGDGDHLAYLTQILTISDFRQKHIAANGEGAPLVPYADYLLFSNKIENRILVNIGGIANFTYLPINSSFDEVVSADSGPGNTLMDAVIQCAKELYSNACLPEPMPHVSNCYDTNGQFALKGIIDNELLNILLAEVTVDGIHLSKNKSTGQEIYNLDFVYRVLKQRMKNNIQIELVTPLMHYLNQGEQAFYNLLATLNLFTAKTISNAIESLHLSVNESKNTTIYLSGGGVHNPVLIKNIENCVKHLPVKLCDSLGVNADAKEAALFAVLANQTLYGSSKVFANNKNVPATAFGKNQFALMFTLGKMLKEM